MSKYRYVDDAVLWTIWQEEEEITWQTAYKIYREPFVRFFQKTFGEQHSVEVYLEIYTQAFTELNVKIVNGKIHLPLNTYLFYYLLIFGRNRFAEKIPNSIFADSLEKANRYLAGDILLELVSTMELNKLVNIFYEFYKKIAAEIINKKWNFQNNESEDSYSDALLIFGSKIKEKKISSPLFGMLFKYFLTIFWRKTRDDRRKWKNGTADDTPIVTRDLNEWNEKLPDRVPEDRDYIDYLLDTKLKGYDFKSNRDLVRKLIEWADEPLKTIVHLRHIEHEKFKDIAAHLGLTPGNVRIILSRGIERFRNIF